MTAGGRTRLSVHGAGSCVVAAALAGRRSSRRLACGFAFAELLVALAIALLVSAALFAMLDPANGAFQVQPEAADVQQRLRVATDVLSADLMAAGSGPAVVRGGDAVPAAAVFPARVGRRDPDPPGTFDSHRMAIWSVSAAAPQAVLAAPLPSASGDAVIEPGPGCLAGDPSCGFRAGMLVGVFAPAGAWDLFSVTAVQGPLLTLRHDFRDGSVIYPSGKTIVAEVAVRTYFHRDAGADGIPRLMRYDGAAGGDIPVVDHVAAFDVSYYGEAEPPSIVPAVADEGERVAYGPAPPPAGVQESQYPAGENCVFARTAGGVPVSRLAALGSGPALVRLDAAVLTDGPWCPDEADSNRYDADLLRVRSVAIALTIEAALASLRGPAGPLFTRGGTARGTRLVPDRRLRVVVAPRVLNASR